MKPTLGRIVLYRLSATDVEDITRRRADFQAIMHKPSEGRSLEAMVAVGWAPGAQAHVGNPVSLGQAYPMVIVQVWPNEYGEHDGVNGQCLLDGNDTLWVLSAKEGTEPGTWSWPPRSP